MTRKDLRRDIFAEKLADALSFLKRKQKPLFLISAGIALACLSFFALNYRLKLREAEAAGLLRKGEILFTQKKFGEALELFQELRGDYSNSEVVEEAIINIGECLFRLGKFDQAEESFNQYLLLYPGGEFSARAQEGIGYIMEERGDFQGALRAYRKIYESYPESYLSPQAMLNTARCYEAMGMLEEAKKSYEKLIASYPWSSLIALARAYLDGVLWEMEQQEK